MSSQPWLVAVGAGRWQLPGIRAARRAGLKILALDGSRDAPGFAESDEFVIADICDPGATIEVVRSTGIKPSGAISFCNEVGMLATAALRDHFGLPCAGTLITRGMTNKAIQRACWSGSQLPVPDWSIVKSPDEVPYALSKIKGEAIFKPVDSCASFGVGVLEKGGQWDALFAEARRHSRSGEVVIESYIAGVEYTVETFTHLGRSDVLAITAKKKVAGTKNTVAFELASAQLDSTAEAQIIDTTIRALQTIGYTDGPGHTELMLADDGIFYLIETAGRGGGFLVADGVVPRASGYDLACASALQAVGLTPDTFQEGTRKAVVLRFLPSRPGKVVSIRGFDPADDIEGVTAEALVSVGQELQKAANDADRMAIILASADTLAEAEAKADMRERRISIVVE